MNILRFQSDMTHITSRSQVFSPEKGERASQRYCVTLVVLERDVMLRLLHLSLFSVASLIGETERSDNAAAIANKTVSLHRILPYRLGNFEVVSFNLPPKCLVFLNV